jgi:hypothetical protein
MDRKGLEMAQSRKPKTQDSNIEKDFTDYFTQTPLIVSLLCDPFEEKLWSVCHRLAHVGSESYISTPKLAILAHMSEDQVVKCRKSLIGKGLLEGELHQDEGANPTWHMVIPDLWHRNAQLVEIYPTIDDQIAFIEEHLK